MTPLWSHCVVCAGLLEGHADGCKRRTLLELLQQAEELRLLLLLLEHLTNCLVGSLPEPDSNSRMTAAYSTGTSMRASAENRLGILLTHMVARRAHCLCFGVGTRRSRRRLLGTIGALLLVAEPGGLSTRQQAKRPEEDGDAQRPHRQTAATGTREVVQTFSLLVRGMHQRCPIQRTFTLNP